MAEVFPFYGFRYNINKISNLNQVVTQPYDKIDKKMQEEYYKKNPYNIVRIILGKENNGDDKYENASHYLQNWINNKILIRDDKPCIYAYYQEYEVEGEKFIRRGFIGLGKLEGEEGVKAHENTLEGPKADRLQLMEATEANFGHIFMLYSDQERQVIKLLKTITDKNDPLTVVEDEDGNLHKIWKITDEKIIADIQKAMKDKTLYIADGHHRYQTALNYRNQCLEKGWKADSVESFHNRLMTFINIDDPGMSVLATHRLIHNVDGFSEKKLLKQVQKDFEIESYNTKEKLYTKMDQEYGKKHVFGFKSHQGNKYYLLTIKNETLMKRLLPGESDVWRKLDVVILHKAILEQYLDIDKKALSEKRNTDYIRYRDQALEEVEKEKYQCVFLLNPTRIKEVKEVADKNERMPQKSTDFYPKLLTGLVINKMEINKE